MNNLIHGIMAYIITGVLVAFVIAVSIPLYTYAHVTWYRRKALRASAEYAALYEMTNRSFTETTINAIPILVVRALDDMEVRCENRNFNEFVGNLSPYTTGCLLTQKAIEILYDENGEDIYANTEKESELSRET